MTVGIIGLGLIGGSMAKALKNHTDYTVWGLDIDDRVVKKALMVEAIDREMTPDDLTSCDIVFIALCPGAALAFFERHLAQFQKGAMVVDVCGIKRAVCAPMSAMSKEAGFVFIGGHPMAGREFSGFEYSLTQLFDGASMILVPPDGTAIEKVDFLRKLCLQLGFGAVIIASPEEHDRMIAYTSQLAHVVSNAYVKSPSALKHGGFSAGSFQDLTRVARLNEEMWSELFLGNRDNLMMELDNIILHLSQYRDALEANDRDTLKTLLKEGRLRKEAADPTLAKTGGN